MLLPAGQSSSRTEYEIDVHAEKGEEDDRTTHNPDQTDTRELHRLALRCVITIAGVSWKVAAEDRGTN